MAVTLFQPTTTIPDRVDFEPDAAVQEVMGRIAQTLPNGLGAPLHPRDAEELLDLVGGHPKAIIQQGVYYYDRHQVETPEIDVLGRVLVHFKVRPEDYVEALIPLLEVSDARLAERARDLLQGANLHSPGDSFQTLAAFFASRARVPDSFLESMIRLAPGDALSEASLKYLERERWRQLIWANHIVADAIWKQEHDFLKSEDTNAALAQLAKLSELEEWWARLYVAEVMNKHRFLRDGKLVERLKQDKHESVRRAAQRGE